MPADAVVHVGNSQEFLSIASAAESFGPGERGTILVHSGSYADSLLISDGRVLGILAMDPGFPSWNGYDDFPQLAVTNGTVIIEGLSVSNGVSPISAVHINGTQARVWVDRSHIVNNSGGGVEVNDGAELTLKNCFVGGLQEGSEALEVNGFNTVATVVFSTIIAGLGSDGGDGTHALQCSSVVGKPLVDVRNSILLNTGGESILCDGVSVANSAVETDDYPGNKEVGGFGGGQFGWFNGIAQGDFSLTPGGAVIFVDVARWNTGDPAVDIFGTSRPNVSNTPDYAGAHLYEAQD
ncbi:hypothetical protein [Paraliomyxa miuraensis]|uniref:hypothetical protein n=1 Tax=Paraliomyxa miuraensis TaxID=376150 RepID=UPI0022575ECF|nr:hypothetical protein [Paraliomyxa miuraensis]MCX4247874.1 hypothetical protein [Paraliomyxa miuraensis]